MSIDYLVMLIMLCFSFLLLLIFVGKTKVREALFAISTAVLFSWPLTLTYTLFGLQNFPVRLFPHATEGSFLFGFIFYPAIFTIYHLHYPREARLYQRLSYSLAFAIFPVLTQISLDLFTNLIHYPRKWVYTITLLLIFIVFNICRKYVNWYFDRAIGGVGL